MSEFVFSINYELALGETTARSARNAYHLHSRKARESLKLSAIALLARSENSLLHFWCHPWDLCTEQHFITLEKLFKKINQLGFEKKRMRETELKK